ncbi:MAG TPA: ATP-binding protein [Candidatus Angelobacter sp.]|nr:ATP-binding protein [Candidatus Angelobacter sp.]
MPIESEIALPDDYGLLSATGEVAELIRAKDWSNSPLGPFREWPQALKTALSVILRCPYAVTLAWGPHLIQLYNDAYIPVLGKSKHPGALGNAVEHNFPEIWDKVGPQLRNVLERGEPALFTDFLLFLEREGRPEEWYCTFSYSPILSDDGRIGGVLNIGIDSSERVIEGRRLRTLSDLAARMPRARSEEEACQSASEALSGNLEDIPFALIYTYDASHHRLRLKGATVAQSPIARSYALIDTDSANLWPVRAALNEGQLEIIEGIQSRLPDLPTSLWGVPTESACVVPITSATHTTPLGILVAGISPRKRFDPLYRRFMARVADQIAANIISARAQAAERRRMRALTELNREKTEFFGNISHEFRTPLGLVLGPVENVLDKFWEHQLPSQADFEGLEIAHRSAMRMLKLVNRLLDFSQAEAGRLRAQFEPVDLSLVTAELAGHFQFAVERAGLRLILDTAPLSDPVFVDREMWEKIVFNLLSNAIKFTLQGEIEISLRQTKKHTDFSLRDTGIGIPGEDLPHIFKRFYRKTGVGRATEGTGIGLALVRDLVKLHGGSIKVTSTVGRGTTFSVRLRTGAAHLPQDQVRQEQVRPGDKGMDTAGDAKLYVEEALGWVEDGRSNLAPIRPEPYVLSKEKTRARILVIDDNVDTRNYLVSLLRAKYEVISHKNVEAARAAIRAYRPDLVITDIVMPGGDGLTFLKALRSDPETRTIPVVLLSARAGDDAKVEGIEHGADDYLIKPFTARELIARVHTHIELARTRREAGEREQMLRSEAEAQRTLLATVLEHMPDGLLIATAPEAEIILTNRKAEQLLRKNAANSRKIQDYYLSGGMHPNGAPYSMHELPLVRSVLLGEVVHGEELYYFHPDGSKRWLYMNSAPIRDNAGRVVAGVLTFLDITELREAEEELLKRRDDQIQYLAGQLITAQEEERRRIARELHDDIAQKLASLSFGLGALKNEGLIQAGGLDKIASLKESIGEILETTRHLSHELHPAVLELAGMDTALRGLCAEFSSGSGISIDCAIHGNAWSLSPDIALCIYRVAQESLHNIRKHSGATHAEVILNIEATQARLTVSDNGHGFDVRKGKHYGSLGLASMEERVRLIRGTFQIDSAPGQGTTLVARLPLTIPQASSNRATGIAS